MPTTPTLLELISKLEKASGPDRELDYEISAVVFGGRAHDLRASDVMNCNPRYTQSIDAALSLVPNDFEWLVESCAHRTHKARAWIKKFGKKNPAAKTSHAETPAIALVIASLRARTAIETGGRNERI